MFGAAVGHEPWVLFPEAAAVSAHVRHGRLDDARALRDDLPAKVERSLVPDAVFLDYPVVGAVVFALAEWELGHRPRTRSTSARAVRLLVCADLFGYNRQLPGAELGARPGPGRGGTPGRGGPGARRARRPEGDRAPRRGPGTRRGAGLILGGSPEVRWAYA